MPRPFFNRRALKEHRRVLRTDGTAAEAVLWQRLKNRQLDGLRFRRQHSAGSYILDFYCPERRLAVELDGGIHAEPGQAAYDAARTVFLEMHGIRVLRISNDALRADPEGVAEAIRAAAAC